MAASTMERSHHGFEGGSQDHCHISPLGSINNSDMLLSCESPAQRNTNHEKDNTDKSS